MKIEKVKKLIANLHEYEYVYVIHTYECVIHIRNSKQAVNQRLVLKKVHIVTKFNQKCLAKTIILIWTQIQRKKN